MRPRPLTLRLRAQNDEAKGLGLALPAGMASVFETVAGQRLLVGEAKIGDKATGERVDYDIGSSPAVQVPVRILPDSDTKDYRPWEVTLTNARPFDAAIEMLIPFSLDPAPRGWDRRGDPGCWRVRGPAHHRG